MAFKKTHIFDLLFFASITFYIISPLCYAVNQGNTDNIFEFKAKTDIEDLIRTVRALANSVNCDDPTPPELVELNYKDNPFYQNFRTFIEQHSEPEYRRDFYCSVSGLSPPSLS